ncbi:MAG: hypothetical protein HC912_01530 [Saprospiraceae bacterium]|nr:hypothetical protein [Saprospiraceae bacterium]
MQVVPLNKVIIYQFKISLNMEKLSLVQLEETNGGGWKSAVNIACSVVGTADAAVLVRALTLTPGGAAILGTATVGCLVWGYFNW